MYVDLYEIDEVFRGRLLWSTSRAALARFRREDHVGNPDVPLGEAVTDLVQAQGKAAPRGPIRLLTHLRYFGYVFNPVSFYFCFDQSERIETVVAEVNNTPWGEQYCYVLDSGQFESGNDQRMEKEFHVSPFMPMDVQYRWQISEPTDCLDLRLDNLRESRRFFDVTMHLRRRPITTVNLTRMLIHYPLMTHRVLAAIYWQAFRLWIKRCPVYPHPRSVKSTRQTATGRTRVQ